MLNLTLLTAENLDDVLHIENSCFSAPWTRSMFESFLIDPNSRCFIADIDGSLVGFGCILLTADEAEIHKVAVLQSHRRNRIGQRIMEAMLGFAYGCGVRTVFLEVRKADAGAVNLYSKLGFVKIAVRRNYYEHPRDDAAVMRLFLHEPKADFRTNIV